MSEQQRNPNSNQRGEGEAAKPTCPICGNRFSSDDEAAAFPFCSQRCRMIDLGKWLNEDYTISRPIEQSDLEEGD